MKVLIQDSTKRSGCVLKSRKMLEAALGGLGRTDCEVSVLITDDPGIRGLNRKYRQKDAPTDVLSFPMEDPDMLGDIVVSVETATRQAEDYGVALDTELARLLVHGLLHLLGHDHVHGGRQARKMKDTEERLIGLLREKGLC